MQLHRANNGMQEPMKSSQNAYSRPHYDGELWVKRAPSRFGRSDKKSSENGYNRPDYDGELWDDFDFVKRAKAPSRFGRSDKKPLSVKDLRNGIDRWLMRMEERKKRNYFSRTMLGVTK